MGNIEEFNSIEKGKKFEEKAYKFLKKEFDKVIWLSKERW